MTDTHDQYTFMIILGAIIFLTPLLRAVFDRIGDVFVSSTIGYLSARYLLDLPQITSLVIAAALSATSVAVSVVWWQETKTINTDTGQLLVTAATAIVCPLILRPLLKRRVQA